MKLEKISFPGFSLFFTTKILTYKECSDMLMKLKLIKQKLKGRFKRISVLKNYKNKVDKVYLKIVEKKEKNIILKCTRK